MTKKSGLALVEKYGKEYFSQLRKKVKHESLVKNGRKGGKRFIELYGKEELRRISRIGRENFRKRIENDKELKEKFRRIFIEQMKKFTKIYPTESGLKVRSQLEQEIANYLATNGIKF